MNSDLEAIKNALDSGEDVNRNDSHALRWACSTGIKEIIEYLLYRGARPTESGKFWYIHVPLIIKRFDTVRLILPYLQESTRSVGFGWVLSYIDIHGYFDLETARFLIDNRISIDSTTRYLLLIRKNLKQNELTHILDLVHLLIPYETITREEMCCIAGQKTSDFTLIADHLFTRGVSYQLYRGIHPYIDSWCSGQSNIQLTQKLLQEKFSSGFLISEYL